MNILITSFILLTIAATILWLRPNARQRQQSKLRAMAIAKGFKIRLNKNSDRFVDYSLPCKTNLCCTVELNNIQKLPPALTQQLTMLPKSIGYVTFDNHSISYSWDEKLEQDLEVMLSFAQKMDDND